MNRGKEPKMNGTTKGQDTPTLRQYVDSDGHFSLVRNFRLADLVTIMNGVCGSLSIFSSARYLVSNDDDYLCKLLLLSHRDLVIEKSFQISFGVAPAVLAFAVGFRSYLDTVCLTGFICCGLARLARFNATVALVPKDATGKARYFEGLPIPSSLGLVGILSYWVRRGWIEGKDGIPGGLITLWGQPGGRGDIHPISVIFGLWAAAMVSKTLRVPKL
ncbi:hypothetical protein ID866_10973 [Astraeus odoratus]|nr:hypothetical protein ID866_10973 [Astraeus odoratus]